MTQWSSRRSSGVRRIGISGGGVSALSVNLQAPISEPAVSRFIPIRCVAIKRACVTSTPEHDALTDNEFITLSPDRSCARQERLECVLLDASASRTGVPRIRVAGMVPDTTDQGDASKGG